MRLHATPFFVTLVVALIAAGAAHGQDLAPEVSTDEDETRPVDESDEEETIEEEASSQVPVPQPPPAPRDRLTLVLTANGDGNLASPNCRAEPFLDASAHHWARQVAHYRAMHQTHESAGWHAPLAMTAGDMTFPGPISRYLLSRGPAGANNLAMTLAQMPLEAFALGGRELSMPRAELVEFARAATQMRLRLQAANVRCDDFAGAEAICDAVGTTLASAPYTVVRRQGLDIAIISVIDDTMFTVIGHEQSEGMRLLDPSEVLRPLISQMRQEADLVVVQYHLRWGEAVPRAHELASDVPGIDLVIANHLFARPEMATGAESSATIIAGGYLVAPTTGTYIVSADSGPTALVLAHLDIGTVPPINDEALRRRRINRLDVQHVDSSDLEPHPETARLIESIAEAYCEDWGRPIGSQRPMEKAFTLQDLQTYILNVMRFTTRSEIALMNRGAFRDQGQFPLTDELTRADVYTVMPYNNELVTAQIQGKVLTALGPRLATDLVGVGIEVRDGNVLINGRAPMADRFYRVALNDFLAHGGDRVFTAEQIRERRTYAPQWSPEAPAISDVVIRFVEGGRLSARAAETQRLSPTGNFPDLHRRFLWTYTGSLNAAYNKVTVVNPTVDDAPAYQQSQLAVASTDQVNLEGRVGIHADSRNHGWNNDLVAQYATARVDGAEGFEETKDLIRYRSQYRYLGLRADLGGQWWVPNPLTEFQLETEFNRPETRDWHRLDLRGILGVSFRLATPLEIKVGANARQDINQPDGEATWGLNAGYTLRRINLLRFLERPIQFESELEYFYNSIGENNIQELRNSNRLFFAVFDQFFFTTTFSAFAYRTDAVGAFGTNTELTLGLHYVWETARQDF